LGGTVTRLEYDSYPGVFLLLSVALLLVLARRRRLPWEPRHAELTTALRSAVATFGLLTLGVPWAESKERAYVTVMKSDLHNLATAQEAMWPAYGRYGDPPDSLYSGTVGVRLEPVRVTEDGWQATAGHTGTTVHCAIYMGSQSLAPARAPGEPACTPLPKDWGVVFRWLGAGIVMVIVGVLLAPRRGRPPEAVLDPP
jgi:hypothetical protein